jgi:two-component system cell cycle response regulator DivK
VLQAVDAEGGIALARERHPRLILMDIQLPGMDGLAATQLLKHEAATSDIKIIALTALAMHEDGQKIKAAGCDGYLAKPIRYHELHKLVSNIMPF